jgi:hypothetical protein
MVIAAYLPPRSGGFAKEGARKATKDKLVKWLHEMLGKARTRTTPILGVDLNDGLGWESTGSEWKQVTDDAVGEVGAGIENDQGADFHAMLLAHNMTAVNTMIGSGEMTWKGAHRAESQIDFLCVPRALIPAVAECFVLQRLGKRLQVIPGVCQRDHWPVFAKIEYSLEAGNSSTQSSPGQRLCWDKDKMMRSLMTGQGRREFIESMEEEFKRLRGEGASLHWQDSSPDAAWTQLNECVMKGGQNFFAKTAKVSRDPEYEKLAEQRLALLKRRRDMKESATDVDELKAQLVVITGLCKRLRQQQASKWKALHIEELHEAWRERDFSRAHALSRRLAGKQTGPRKRNYAVATRAQPLASEWAEFWKNSGPKGGMSAVPCCWAEVQEEHSSCMEGARLRTMEHVEQAEEDLQAMRRILRKAKKRRAVPVWSAPLELWWMLLWPNYRTSMKMAGVGLPSDKVRNPVFFRIHDAGAGDDADDRLYPSGLAQDCRGWLGQRGLQCRPGEEESDTCA